MANRWFVLPIEETATGVRRPKYVDRDGIRGFSGQVHYFDAETYPRLPFAGEEMYVARVYGTSEAIDALADEQDAYGKQEYALSDSEVAAYLNDRLDEDRSFTEWLDTFEVT